MSGTHHNDKDLAAAIVHDLRAPLNACVMSVSLIELQASQSPDVLRSVEVLRRNLDRQALLVKDLGDLLDVMAGGLPLALTEVELVELIDAAAKPIAAGADVHIEWGCGRPLPCRLRADSERLGRAIGIVLEMVAAATPAGGRIEMALTDDSGAVRVEARRRGDGAAGRKYPVMREVVAREIVAAHGGRLQLDPAVATIDLTRG